MPTPKLQPDGQWKVRYRNPPGVVPQQPERLYPTKKAAEADIRAFLVDKDSIRKRVRETGISASMLPLLNGTVREVGDAWLAQTPSRGTAYQNKSRLENHVYPKIGGMPINTVKPAQIHGLIRWWQENDLASSTQLSIFANIKSTFTWAAMNDLLMDAPNPFDKVRTPTVDQSLQHAWPDAWMGAVTNGIRKDVSPLPLLCGYLGLRQGEAFGASPDDFVVNRHGRKVFLVRRQVKMVGSRLFFAPPKHRKHDDSPREIPVPDFVWDAVTAYQEDRIAREVTLDYDRNDATPLQEMTVKLLLTTREGFAWNRNYFNPFIWKPTLVGADIPSTRENGTHAMRHWFAATALALGMPITQLSEQLGHRDRAFTLKIYGRFQPEGNADVATGFARIAEQMLKK